MPRLSLEMETVNKVKNHRIDSRLDSRFRQNKKETQQQHNYSVRRNIYIH